MSVPQAVCLFCVRANIHIEENSKPLLCIGTALVAIKACVDGDNVVWARLRENALGRNMVTGSCLLLPAQTAKNLFAIAHNGFSG